MMNLGRLTVLTMVLSTLVGLVYWKTLVKMQPFFSSFMYVFTTNPTSLFQLCVFALTTIIAISYGLYIIFIGRLYPDEVEDVVHMWKYIFADVFMSIALLRSHLDLTLWLTIAFTVWLRFLIVACRVRVQNIGRNLGTFFAYVRLWLLLMMLVCVGMVAVFWHAKEIWVNISTRSLFAFELVSATISAISLQCKFYVNVITLYHNTVGSSYSILPREEQPWWYRNIMSRTIIASLVQLIVDNHTLLDAINTSISSGIQFCMYSYILVFYFHVVLPIHTVRHLLTSMSKLYGSLTQIKNIYSVRRSLASVFTFVSEDHIPDDVCGVCLANFKDELEDEDDEDEDDNNDGDHDKKDNHDADTITNDNADGESTPTGIPTTSTNTTTTPTPTPTTTSSHDTSSGTHQTKPSKLSDSVGYLPCGHFFHKACVNEWLHRDHRCPVCRKNAYKTTPVNITGIHTELRHLHQQQQQQPQQQQQQPQQQHRPPHMTSTSSFRIYSPQGATAIATATTTTATVGTSQGIPTTSSSMGSTKSNTASNTNTTQTTQTTASPPQPPPKRPTIRDLRKKWDPHTRSIGGTHQYQQHTSQAATTTTTTTTTTTSTTASLSSSTTATAPVAAPSPVHRTFSSHRDIPHSFSHRHSPEATFPTPTDTGTNVDSSNHADENTISPSQSSPSTTTTTTTTTDTTPTTIPTMDVDTTHHPTPSTIDNDHQNNDKDHHIPHSLVQDNLDTPRGVHSTSSVSSSSTSSSTPPDDHSHHATSPSPPSSSSFSSSPPPVELPMGDHPEQTHKGEHHSDGIDPHHKNIDQNDSIPIPRHLLSSLLTLSQKRHHDDHDHSEEIRMKILAIKSFHQTRSAQSSHNNQM